MEITLDEHDIREALIEYATKRTGVTFNLCVIYGHKDGADIRAEISYRKPATDMTTREFMASMQRQPAEQGR